MMTPASKIIDDLMLEHAERLRREVEVSIELALRASPRGIAVVRMGPEGAEVIDGKIFFLP